jgi:hypothetical protein
VNPKAKVTYTLANGEVVEQLVYDNEKFEPADQVKNLSNLEMKDVVWTPLPEKTDFWENDQILKKVKN